MRSRRSNLISRFDTVIVGSGIAGMLLALELDRAGMRCALISKSKLFDSNTSWAQGGIAICTGTNPADDPGKHLADTLSAGAGLCRPQVAETIIAGANELFEKLESYGICFDRQNGKLELAREGGHSQSRILHTKDATGKSISSQLIAALQKSRRLAVFEDCFALDLLISQDRCIGLQLIKDKSLVEILSARVVLASGGLGQVFSRTTNPLVATGDGIAMAYRAGAQLADMEFVQFHPTALCLPGRRAALITEAVRGAGAELLDAAGERFAFRFHKDGELATRDLVARAIATVMAEEQSSNVWLNLRPIGARKLEKSFPNVLNTCKTYGIDPSKESIPVAPAAHYFMGGIWTDLDGRSTVQGLYAIGESAATGLHGANRLASNSLLEGGVMALRCARAILGSKAKALPATNIITAPLLHTRSCFKTDSIQDFKKEFFNKAGIVRSGAELAAMQTQIQESPLCNVPLQAEAIEAANCGLLSQLILEAAIYRRESRGAHFRADFPRENPAYLGSYFLSKSGSKLIAFAEHHCLTQEFSSEDNTLVLID